LVLRGGDLEFPDRHADSLLLVRSLHVSAKNAGGVAMVVRNVAVLIGVGIMASREIWFGASRYAGLIGYFLTRYVGWTVRKSGSE
jgi:hypothetical protein